MYFAPSEFRHMRESAEVPLDCVLTDWHVCGLCRGSLQNLLCICILWDPAGQAPSPFPSHQKLLLAFHWGMCTISGAFTG